MFHGHQLGVIIIFMNSFVPASDMFMAFIIQRILRCVQSTRKSEGCKAHQHMIPTSGLMVHALNSKVYNHKVGEHTPQYWKS